MQSAQTIEPAKQEIDGHSATRRQIRGSSLLLVGQVLSKGLNFAVQVMVVRYLTKSDYGAFSYALTIVTLCETMITLGLDRAITRFVPIYHEQKNFRKMFGTIFFVFGVVTLLSIFLILLFFELQGLIRQSFIKDPQAIALLFILIFLAPINALDTLLNGMFAVFSRPGAIFFRKYVLGPVLKLVVVGLLLLARSDVQFLATGHLAAGIVAIVIYALILLHAFKEQGLLQQESFKNFSMPVLEILTFTIPLLTSDLVYSVMNSVDAVLVERFHGTIQVATLRAVQPTAKLNQLVLASFGMLFTPAAARMFARNDRKEVNDLYWQNAVWIAIVSFPIFALTFSLARPVTLLLYGERYEQSAVILALLSLGYYFNAALGQNGLTLKVFGKVRYIVGINLFVSILNLGLNLFLIPRFGVIGAAVGTFTTMVVFNILKQAGLLYGTGIALLEPRYLRVYMIIAFSAIGLLVLQLAMNLPVYLSMALAVISSLAVVRLNRRILNVRQTFPELLRLPFMKYLLGA